MVKDESEESAKDSDDRAYAREHRDDDVELMRHKIRAHLEEKDIRVMFWDMGSAREEIDEILLHSLGHMLGKMNDLEKERALEDLVKFAQEASPFRGEVEAIVDKVVKIAYEKGIVPASVYIETMAMTADFTLRSKFNSNKFKEIKNNLHLVDYKGLRSLMKKLIYNLVKLPNALSVEQRRLLIPVEELLLHLMDRRTNVFPALFSSTELSRMQMQYSKKVYLFPRLARAATKLDNSFRTTAELCTTIGRCFLYPVPDHPAFVNSAIAWRVDNSSSCILHRMVMLPYRSELLMPQTYLLYMILRQPRGKEHLMNIIRLTHANIILSLDEMVAVIISETMAQVEALPPGADIPRYQWENIFSIFVFEISQKQVDFCRCAKLLTATLTKTGYRRGRDELMWILLQYVGFSINNVEKEQIDAVVELYRAMYSEEETWTGASDHPQTLVRYLSPACLWIMLGERDLLPAPHGSLLNQINFIKNWDGAALEDEIKLAVWANAYCPENGQHMKVVTDKFRSRLDGLPHEEGILLSYNKIAHAKMTSMSIEFLDSLTLQAKKLLLSSCLLALRKSDKLPSFAAVETIAKLLNMMEFDHGAKIVICQNIPKLFGSVIPLPLNAGPQQQAINECFSEQLFILLDMTAFRLAAMPYGLGNRQSLLMQVLSGMAHAMVQSNSQLFFHLDHLAYRMMVWMPYAECIQLTASFLKESCMMRPQLFMPHTFCQPITDPVNHPSNLKFAITPEVVRIFFINMLKTYKITGHDPKAQQDLFPHILTAYPMPASCLLSFPNYILPVNEKVQEEVNQEEILQQRLNQLLDDVHLDFINLTGMVPESYVEYFRRTDQKPTLLCIIFRMMYEERNASWVTFYNILEQMPPRQLILCTNALVDYVLHQVATNMDKTQDFFMTTARVLNDMCFHCQVIPFDRLLLALAAHPVTDEMSQLALLFIRSLITYFTGFRERAMAYLHSVPPSFHPQSPDFCRKLAEYHKKFPEMTYPELAMHSMHNSHDPIQPQTHMPVYYGSLIDRIMPTVDFAICRMLELQMPDDVFNDIMDNFGPLYKYHPFPITFVYTTLFCLFDQLSQSQRARQFALKIINCSDQALTVSFINFNHQKGSVQSILGELVHRVIEASEFILTPPSYVAQDWRLAEFSPTAQVIFQACIEIMASPHPPKAITSSFVSLMWTTRQPRPFLALNAVGLLLAALPPPYSARIYDEIVDILEAKVLEDMSLSDIAFNNFEHSVAVQNPKRVTALTAVAQAYWMHCNLADLLPTLRLIESDLSARVHNEKELIFVIRLLFAFLQRLYHAREKNLKIEDCFNLVVIIYNITGQVCQEVGNLEYEDMICDLFYQLKYLYVGDFVRKETEIAISKMSQSMQEKLKYINMGPAPQEGTDPLGREEKFTDAAKSLAAKLSIDLSNVVASTPLASHVSVPSL